jgi:hypothetical protein
VVGLSSSRRKRGNMRMGIRKRRNRRGRRKKRGRGG